MSGVAALSAAFLVASHSLAQLGDPAPCVLSVTPNPAGGINNQVGLDHVSILMSEPVTIGLGATTACSTSPQRAVTAARRARS